MTLHSGRQKSEAIEDPIEGEVIALPGERAAAPVVAMGSESGVAALPEDRMIDFEGRAGRDLREQLDRAIASASAALRHQLAPQTVAANDAIGVGEEIRLGAGAAQAPVQAARKPLWMTPLFIGLWCKLSESMQRNAREHYAVHAARTAFQISDALLSWMRSFPSLN